MTMLFVILLFTFAFCYEKLCMVISVLNALTVLCFTSLINDHFSFTTRLSFSLTSLHWTSFGACWVYCLRFLYDAIADINIDFTIFFLKTSDRICFLIPENIRIGILFMSLAYVVAKLFAKMFIFIYVGGHLGFSYFGPFSRPIKKCNPFFSWSSWYFESESSEKSILTDKMHESVICDIWACTTSVV